MDQDEQNEVRPVRFFFFFFLDSACTTNPFRHKPYRPHPRQGGSPGGFQAGWLWAGALGYQLLDQAGRDLVTGPTLAFQEGDGGGECGECVKASWKSISTPFWQRTAADGEASKLQAPKLHRKKTYEWLCGTSHMLMVAIGATWATRQLNNCSNIVKFRHTHVTIPMASQHP